MYINMITSDGLFKIRLVNVYISMQNVWQFAGLLHLQIFQGPADHILREVTESQGLVEVTSDWSLQHGCANH